MYVKRQTIAKTWPIPRKGTKYLVVASHNKRTGLPLLIILREILKIVKTRAEAKKILYLEQVRVNDKIIREENFSVALLDLVKIGDKNYELIFSDKGKFLLKETARKENILKIVGKTILKNKKIQLNLLYGRNILSDERQKLDIGDSVVLDKGKIVKVLPMENDREVIVIGGKYKGKTGKIEKINKNIATVSCKNEKINIPIKNVLVTN